MVFADVQKKYRTTRQRLGAVARMAEREVYAGDSEGLEPIEAEGEEEAEQDIDRFETLCRGAGRFDFFSSKSDIDVSAPSEYVEENGAVIDDYEDNNPEQYMDELRSTQPVFLSTLAASGSFVRAAEATTLPLRAWLWWKARSSTFSDAWELALEEGDLRIIQDFIQKTMEGEKIQYRPLSTALKMRRPERYVPPKIIERRKPKAEGDEEEITVYLRTLSWLENQEMDEDAKAKLIENLNNSFSSTTDS